MPRPLHITVETDTLTGELVSTDYCDGLARLILHEIDHLDGLLYVSRMRAGVSPLPVEEYKLSGRKWTYD